MAISDSRTAATASRREREPDLHLEVERRQGGPPGSSRSPANRSTKAFKDEQFDFEMLYDDSFVVLAGVQNPWARRRKIELAELVNEPWALPAQEGVVGEAFRASGLDYPRATLVTSSPELRTSFVATGRFLTMAAFKFPARHPELKVLPVELPMADLPVGIFTLRNHTLSPVAKLFIQHAREVAKPLAKRK